MKIFLKNYRYGHGRRRTSGFTLIEIMVVLAIIAIVAIVGIERRFPIGYHDSIIRNAKLFVTDGVSTPLMSYRLHTGSYPTTRQGLRALIMAPEKVEGWDGPYLADNIKTTPLDPWNHEYHYAYPGVHNPKRYDCWSDGPDGVNGTADDIGNW